MLNEQLVRASTETSLTFTEKEKSQEKDLAFHLNKSQLRQLVEADWVPPDGGWGWMCVIGCFLAFGLIVAMSRTFGIIYNDVREAFPESLHTQVAMIPAMIITLVVGLGAVGGALTIAFNVRNVAFIGGLFAGTGVSLNFFAMNVYYMLFCYVLAGIGAGLACNPALMTVAKYFRKKRTQAVGFSLAGTGVGAIVQPPLLQLLVDVYGFRGALLLQGGLLFHVCAGALLLRDPVTKKKMKKLKEKLANNAEFRQAIRTRYSVTSQQKTNACFKWVENHLYLDLTLLYQAKFIVVLFSVFFLTIGYPQTLTFIPPHAVSLNYTKIEGGLLISICSGGDLIGRFINGFIFDRNLVGKQTGFIVSTLIVSISIVGMALLTNYIAMAVCLILYGYFAGCAFILIPVILSENHGAPKLASSLGIARSCMGISAFVGPLLGGYIVDVTGSFVATLLTFGAINVLASLVMFYMIPVRAKIRNLWAKCCRKS